MRSRLEWLLRNQGLTTPLQVWRYTEVLEENPSLAESYAKGEQLDKEAGVPCVDPTFSRAFGQPMVCRHERSLKSFNDGFGLSSPGRWRPEARGQLDSEGERAHAERVFGLLSDFVREQLPDLQRAAFQLVSGKVKSSPFKSDAVGRLRRSIASLLPDPVSAMMVAERQPFFLSLLSQSLHLLGDPDASILCEGEECFAKGVPLGHRSPIPRTPQVFRRRIKQRKLDETPFEPIMQNYASTEMSATQLEEQFQKDADNGMMIPMTEASAVREFGADNVLVAAMGAVAKPNGDIRPLRDATHGVNLNNRISILDRLEVPGPEELVEAVRLAQETGQVAFCVSADIAQAHRRVKIKRSEWGYLGCKSSSSSTVLWINAVGTFGVSSASYWWTRLFACLERWSMRVLRNRWQLQIVFVDDLRIVVVGPEKYLHLWVIILAYEVLGTPLSYHKFGGGLQADFIGYRLSYQSWSVGIAPKRVKWIISWVDDVEASGLLVTGRSLTEFVGRMGFVARILTWIKPFLTPLYAFTSTVCWPGEPVPGSQRWSLFL